MTGSTSASLSRSAFSHQRKMHATVFSPAVVWHPPDGHSSPPKPTPPSLSLNPPSVLRCVCLSGPGDASSPRASTPIWGPTPIVKTSLPPTHYPISNSISPYLPFLPPTSFSISSSGFNVFSFLRSELMQSTST